MKFDNEDGISIIWVSVGLLLIFGLAALVVDLGNGRNQKVRLQTTTDAAALAGALELPASTSAAHVEAAAYAYTNLGIAGTPVGSPCPSEPGSMCYVTGDYLIRIVSPYTPTSAPGDPGTFIHVETCQQVATTFARVVGVNSMNVCAEATAQNDLPATALCALCVLGSTGTTLSSTGAGRLETIDGGIVVNSSDPDAVKISNSSGRIIAGPVPPSEFGIHGGYSAADPMNLQPTPVTGYTPVPDPLAALPVPVVAGPLFGSVSVSGSSSMSLAPGIYDKITSSSSGTIDLAPGIYVITGEIKLSKSPAAGQTSLIGSDVMLYFACSSYPAPCGSGESGAEFSSSGGATVNLTGRSGSDPEFAGMAVYFDRNNTSSISLTGSSDTSVTGTIYVKSGTVSLTGPSGVSTFSAAIVANNVIKTGDSTIVLDFDAETNHAALAQSTGNGGLVE